MVFDGVDERVDRLLPIQRVLAIFWLRGRAVRLHRGRAITVRPEHVVRDVQTYAVDGEFDNSGSVQRGSAVRTTDGPFSCSTNVQVERATKIVQRVLGEDDHHVRVWFRPHGLYLLHRVIQPVHERVSDLEGPAVVQPSVGAREMRVRPILVQYVWPDGRSDGRRHVLPCRSHCIVRYVPEHHFFQKIPTQQT